MIIRVRFYLVTYSLDPEGESATSRGPNQWTHQASIPIPRPRIVARSTGTSRSEWEAGPLLALVKKPLATHAAEELAGLERFRDLLVHGDGGRVHAGQRTRWPRHRHGVAAELRCGTHARSGGQEPAVARCRVYGACAASEARRVPLRTLETHYCVQNRRRVAA